jgi:putative membrane protein
MSIGAGRGIGGPGTTLSIAGACRWHAIRGNQRPIRALAHASVFMEATMHRTLWAMAGLTAITMGSVPAFAETSEFLTKAIKGDNSETKLGALAASRGHSRAVRDFGAMLARDHRKAKAQAEPVAVRHHVRVPAAMADEAKDEYAKLQGMRGAAFDREFARYMVDDHHKDIADFEAETNSRDPADVRALARQTLPALRKHLATARSIR